MVKLLDLLTLLSVTSEKDTKLTKIELEKYFESYPSKIDLDLFTESLISKGILKEKGMNFEKLMTLVEIKKNVLDISEFLLTSDIRGLVSVNQDVTINQLAKVFINQINENKLTSSDLKEILTKEANKKIFEKIEKYKDIINTNTSTLLELNNNLLDSIDFLSNLELEIEGLSFKNENERINILKDLIPNFDKYKETYNSVLDNIEIFSNLFETKITSNLEKGEDYRSSEINSQEELRVENEEIKIIPEENEDVIQELESLDLDTLDLTEEKNDNIEKDSSLESLELDNLELGETTEKLEENSMLDLKVDEEEIIDKEETKDEVIEELNLELDEYSALPEELNLSEPVDFDKLNNLDKEEEEIRKEQEKLNLETLPNTRKEVTKDDILDLDLNLDELK